MLTKSELAAFVADLRANGHRQGRVLLCQDAPDGTQKFCCLGRLAELHNLPREITSGGIWVYNFVGELFSFRKTNHLTGQLEKKLGMGPFGTFPSLGMPDMLVNSQPQESLASANDAGATFAEIADHLERYYPCSDESR